MNRSLSSYLPSRSILIGIGLTGFLALAYLLFQVGYPAEEQAFSRLQEHVQSVYKSMQGTLGNPQLTEQIQKWTERDQIPGRAYRVLQDKPFEVGYYSGDSLLFWSKEDKQVYPPLQARNAKGEWIRGNPPRLYLQHTVRGNRTLSAIYSLPTSLNDLSSYQHSNADISYGNGPRVLKLQSTETSVRIEGSDMPILFSLGGIICFLALILFLCIGLHKTALNIKDEHNALRAGMFLVAAVFFFRFLLLWSGALDLFNHMPLFEHQLDPSGNIAPYVGGDSIADIFLNMCFLFWLSTFLISHLEIASFDHLPSLNRFSVAVLNYFGICLELMLLSYVLKHLIIYSDISFDFDHIFSLSLNSLMGLVSILLFVVGQFFLSYLLAHINHKLSLSSTTRLWALLAACVVSLPVFLYIDLDLHPFPFFAALIAYNVLLDIFWDREQSKTSWLIIWLMVLSGLTAVLLYKYSQDHERLQRKEFVQNLYDDYRRDNIKAGTFDSKHSYYDFSIYINKERSVFNNSTYEINYPFDTVPAVGQMFEWQHGQRSELLYSPAQGLILMAGHPEQTGLLKPISLFSYTFTLLSALVLILVILNRYYSFLPRRWSLKDHQKHSLRRTIQFALIALSIFSFLVVSLITVWYFNHTYDEDMRAELQNKANAITSRLQEQSVDRPGEWRREVFNLAKAHQTDIRVYDSGGQFDFQATSDFASSSKLPLRIPYDILTRLQLQGGTFQRVEDNGGTSAYIAYGSWNPQVGHQTYFSTPQQIQAGSPLSPVNDFISTLLNVYVFLFLISGILAVLVADSITKPLKQLSERLREFRLGKKNEPIPWERKDELGELITDYNRMVKELDESAEILAMTQRELAWREMAKQVAHEIKNPLTPMRLSIQHLQMANQQNQDEASDRIERISQTLLEQIDSLSQIASEFSNFAKMPKPENEKIVLNDVVASVHDLFRKRDDMDINCYVPIDELFVFADRNQLRRVMNNILKNAIQSIPTEQRGTIDIKLYKKDEMAVVRVSDNGNGIPEEIREKIFSPNFTSKSSGTGLGLAISANIIESINGSIYFETEVGQGTTFYIEIPLMHMEDNFRDPERVIL